MQFIKGIFHIYTEISECYREMFNRKTLIFKCNNFYSPKLDAIDEGGSIIVGFELPVMIIEGVPLLLIEDCGIRRVDDV